MLFDPKLPNSFEYVKNCDLVYFELLRLACVTLSPHNIIRDLEAVTSALNKLPLYESGLKRIIPLLNDKAHKLDVFNKLSIESQEILIKATQQGVVTELARKMVVKKIAKVLAAHNIPLILLKGAAFAEVLYSIQAPRTANDLDILIRKDDWYKAVSVIKELMEYTKKYNSDVFGDLYELSFVPKNKIGIALDLHSSLIHPLLFNIDEKKMWEDSVEHPSFDNTLIRVLSPEHALIHQAIHAFKDMNFGKYNLIDTYEIIKFQKPDFNEVILLAKTWGVSIPLFVLLKSCNEIMMCGIEASVLKQIEPNFIIRFFIVELLKSPYTHPEEYKKSIRYRLNQIARQFIFSGSFTRPLTLQWLFVKSYFMSQKNVRSILD